MEGEFRIKPDAIIAEAEIQNKIADTMRELETELYRIRDGLNFEIAQKAWIRTRLTRAGNAISRRYTGIYSAAKALREIAKLCRDTDNKVANVRITDFNPGA